MAEHVCPVWVGYLLASPIRRLFHNPQQLLEDYVQPGMTVLDVGCAMGFFSIPMAKWVGPRGRVLCVDVQEKMLRSLKKRAQKNGLLDRIALEKDPQLGRLTAGKRLSLPQAAFMVPGLDTDPDVDDEYRRYFRNVFETCADPFIDAGPGDSQGDVYVIRTVQAQPKRAPASFEAVREQLIQDVRRARAYEAAEQSARKLADAVKPETPLKDALEGDPELKADFDRWVREVKKR